MEFDQLSNEAKILFVIWINLPLYYQRYEVPQKWFAATGKPVANFEEYNQAVQELDVFMEHCKQLRQAVISQRAKDHDRMRRLSS